MSDRFESTNEITEYHTEQVFESLKRGQSMKSIVAGIIVSAAKWGAENTKLYWEGRAKQEKEPWDTLSDAQLEQYTKSRNGLQKTLAQALLDTRIALRAANARPR